MTTILDDILDGRRVCCGEPAPGHAPWCGPVAFARASVGLPTRPPGTPNRARFLPVPSATGEEIERRAHAVAWRAR